METECSVWEGRPEFWQEQALLALVEAGRRIMPWSWVESECGLLCLEESHLVALSPQRLSYPQGQCVYCGMFAQSKDHLIPTAYTGLAYRNQIMTVPACTQCNSAINDSPIWTVDGRRRIAQAHIARKYKRVLARPDYTPEEIAEFEGRLRQAVIAGIEEKDMVRERLAWPEDPNYDLRWLQKSGIENPYLSGMLETPADENR